MPKIKNSTELREGRQLDGGRPASGCQPQHREVAQAQTEQAFSHRCTVHAEGKAFRAALRDDNGEDKEEEEAGMTYRKLLTPGELPADRLNTTTETRKPREMSIQHAQKCPSRNTKTLSKTLERTRLPHSKDQVSEDNLILEKKNKCELSNADTNSIFN